jgi:hypothetical protein
MPKPYHTPKSERDEKVGALVEAEQVAEIRFTVTYTDLHNEETHWEFFAASHAEGVEKAQAEAFLQNKGGQAFPWIGDIHKIELYDFGAREWETVPVPV